MRNAFRQNIVLDKRQRLIMYRVLLAQLRGGIPFDQACQVIDRSLNLNPVINRIAKAGHEATNRGKRVTEGLSIGGYLPIRHTQIIDLAEQNDRLMDAFDYLIHEDEESLGIWNSVVWPKIYFTIVLGALLFASTQIHTLLDKMGTRGVDVGNILAYKVSVFLADWILWIVGIVFWIITVIAWARRSSTGLVRKLLAHPIDDWNRRLALATCRLSVVMYQQGANHMQALTACEHSMGGTYVQHCIKIIRYECTTEGLRYLDAISGRLLTKDLASVLGGLAPSGSSDDYILAMQTVANVYAEQVKAMYAGWQHVYTLIIMLGIAAMILMNALGMFSVFSMFMQRM